jgi:heme-degrading monooxygenase HmoA
MIARRWTGRVPADRFGAYLDVLDRTGLRHYAATPGHRGTTVLSRAADGVTEIEITTLWESEDAIRAFAGDDIGLAVYYPEDEGYLLDFPERVEHWEVVER